MKVVNIYTYIILNKGSGFENKGRRGQGECFFRSITIEYKYFSSSKKNKIFLYIYDFTIFTPLVPLLFIFIK